MNPDELKSGLVRIHDGIKEIQEWRQEKDERDDKNQKAIDHLLMMRHATPFPEGGGSFESQLSQGIKQNFESIKTVGGRKAHSFNLKVGDMTRTTTLTSGNPIASYVDPSLRPGQGGTNFRDLVRIVPVSTGWVQLPREVSSSGSISRVTTEGSAKPQIDYQFNMITFNAQYIAGYARISKELLQDLNFLQSFLPRQLLRDFYTAENAQLYADLTSVATGSTTTSATVYAEKLIDWIANLGAAGYAPNTIVGTFAEWASLMKTVPTSGTAYSLPGGMTIGASGESRIAGIPYFPAAWVATGKTIVADFTQAALAVADSLKVEFFEQDQDNVIKNMVTVRVEAREVLVIEQPSAFIFA